MKKNYIQPQAKTYPADYDLDLMIPVGSGGVDDGFAKERDEDFEEEIDMEAIINQKDGWKSGLW